MEKLVHFCQGESHKATGKVCQDYAMCSTDNGIAVAVLSDGHGGSRYFRSDVGSKTIKELMGESYYYPFSMFFLKELRPILKDYFIVDSEYENTFYIWEHMKSLIYGYNKCYILSESFPFGEFIRRESMYKVRGYEEEPYMIFWESADSLKNEWAPIKQGMFGGRYENYKAISEKANAFYKEYRRF